MSFSTSGGRRSASSGGGNSPAVNGGFGYWAGGGRQPIARELIEGHGIEIDDPSARWGNSTIRVKAAIFEITAATVNGQGGVQKLGIMGGLDRVEFTHVSFRLFSAQPTIMRGGVYTRPDATNTNEAELVSTGQGYERLASDIGTLRFAVSPFFRKATGLWWVPSVPSDIPLTFEISVWGMPRYETPSGSQEVSG